MIQQGYNTLCYIKFVALINFVQAENHVSIEIKLEESEKELVAMETDFSKQ